MSPQSEETLRELKAGAMRLISAEDVVTGRGEERRKKKVKGKEGKDKETDKR